MVEAVEWDFLLNIPVDVIVVSYFRGLCFTRVVRPVAIVDTFGVALNRVVAIDDWVLAGEVWLVEVVFVLDICPSHPRLDENWRIGTNEEGNAASTSSRARITLLVQRNVASHDDSIPTIPTRRLEPIHRVENGVSAAVACTLKLPDSSNSCMSTDLIDLNLSSRRLGANLESANVLGIGRDAMLTKLSNEII